MNSQPSARLATWHVLVTTVVAPLSLLNDTIQGINTVVVAFIHKYSWALRRQAPTLLLSVSCYNLVCLFSDSVLKTFVLSEERGEEEVMGDRGTLARPSLLASFGHRFHSAIASGPVKLESGSVGGLTRSSIFFFMETPHSRSIMFVFSFFIPRRVLYIVIL